VPRSLSARRGLAFRLIGVRHKGLDCWTTPLWVRLAYAGACPSCGVTFSPGDPVQAAFRHVLASKECCRTIAHEIEQPAWQTEQDRLRRRAESTNWTAVREGRCRRCGDSFLTVRPRQHCRAPICERAGGRERGVRWRERHPPAVASEINCACCSRPFVARRRFGVYCGPTCRQRARRRRLRNAEPRRDVRSPRDTRVNHEYPRDVQDGD
jgi:hypothetical protein